MCAETTDEPHLSFISGWRSALRLFSPEPKPPVPDSGLVTRFLEYQPLIYASNLARSARADAMATRAPTAGIGEFTMG